MRVCCVQMDMALGRAEENFRRAAALTEQAARTYAPDVIVLPETWNTGFFPRRELAACCDHDCAQTREVFGALARRLGVNIVAGSVSDLRGGRIYNTACVFDRTGAMLAQYDKTHLFTPMGEDAYYTPGGRLCRFRLDGMDCGLLLCYDLRFPELARTLAVAGMDVLFAAAQWPAARLAHLHALVTARAIENQCFTVCCNSCGTAGETVYGGGSMIVGPWGETLAMAGTHEELLTADCDRAILQQIRASINVFRDRRPELYRL